MQRRVEPEWLDELPPDDPRAVRSRRDLQRVNVWMRHAEIMSRILARAFVQRPPQRIVELGAGDGRFMLRLARRLVPRWGNAEVVLVDRQQIVSGQTQQEFKSLGWNSEIIQADVFDWVSRSVTQPADLIIANLFLHHFREQELRQLLNQAASRTNCFLACEPRRSAVALKASRMLWLIGCNAVTRHDAVISVRAGFDGEELSELWPANGEWLLTEIPAGLFSHCFMAQRKGVHDSK